MRLCHRRSGVGDAGRRALGRDDGRRRVPRHYRDAGKRRICTRPAPTLLGLAIVALPVTALKLVVELPFGDTNGSNDAPPGRALLGIEGHARLTTTRHAERQSRAKPRPAKSELGRWDQAGSRQTPGARAVLHAAPAVRVPHGKVEAHRAPGLVLLFVLPEHLLCDVLGHVTGASRPGRHRRVQVVDRHAKKPTDPEVLEASPVYPHSDGGRAHARDLGGLGWGDVSAAAIGRSCLGAVVAQKGFEFLTDDFGDEVTEGSFEV